MVGKEVEVEEALRDLVCAARIHERTWSVCRAASVLGAPLSKEVEDLTEQRLAVALANVKKLMMGGAE
jgi:hypothetical protein